MSTIDRAAADGPTLEKILNRLDALERGGGVNIVAEDIEAGTHAIVAIIEAAKTPIGAFVLCVLLIFLGFVVWQVQKLLGTRKLEKSLNGYGKRQDGTHITLADVNKQELKYLKQIRQVVFAMARRNGSLPKNYQEGDYL